LLLFAALALGLEAQTPKTPATCKVRLAEDFVPMTWTERAADYVAGITGPGAVAFSAALAGANQAADRPMEWTGGEGFGLRLASAYGERLIGESVEHGMAFGLHQDNRYFGSGQHGFGRRLAYALESSVLARRDNGSRTISFSAIGGMAAGAFASHAWQPPSTATVGGSMVQFGFGMGIRAAFDVMREFSPRFLGRVLQ